MTHSEIQDLLEAFVDDALDRPTRKLVETHVAGCEECQAILDDVAEVDLSGLAGGAVDERQLKKSVRKAMRRTIADAVMAIVAAWIIIWFIGAALVQPLVVNRSGRAAQAARATIDSAIMFNPGATLTNIQIDSKWLSRLVTADLALQVGAGTESIGTVESRIGMFGFGDPSGGSFMPYLNTEASSTIDETGLQRLGESTVATVQLYFTDSLSMTRAQELADSTTNDVRVIWAGFPTSAAATDGSTRDDGLGMVGYATCGVHLPDDDFFGASSASSSGTNSGEPASIEDAKAHLTQALANMNGGNLAPDIIAASMLSNSVIQDGLNYLSGDDQVTVLVVTGPSQEVARFIEEAGQPSVVLLGVDFYNWSTPICGR